MSRLVYENLWESIVLKGFLYFVRKQTFVDSNMMRIV